MGYTLGLFRDNGKENGNYCSMLGLDWANGKENGSYYSMLGLHWDNGKENGNYFSILGVYRVIMGNLGIIWSPGQHEKVGPTLFGLVHTDV